MEIVLQADARSAPTYCGTTTITIAYCEQVQIRNSYPFMNRFRNSIPDYSADNSAMKSQLVERGRGRDG